MGDDELNFTEEEARDWADDPRNLPQDWSKPEQAFALSAILVIAVLVLMWLLSIPIQQQAPDALGAALIGALG
jgi:hypothetical protein